MAYVFDTMATLFNNMPGGRWWGCAFFLFMTFAALSTVLAVFETIISCVRDMTGWSRVKSSIICSASIFVLSLTTALGYSIFNFHPFSADSAWLDFWDFCVNTNLLPLGSAVIALFCCNKRFGWGWDNFMKEANSGKGLKVKQWMKPIFTYFVPAIIFFLYIYSLINFKWR